jgi:hypothetical protein
MVGIGPMTQTSRVARVQAITTDMTDADLGRCLPILQRSGMKFFQLRNECAGSQSDSGSMGIRISWYPAGSMLYSGNTYRERL